MNELPETESAAQRGSHSVHSQAPMGIESGTDLNGSGAAAAIADYAGKVSLDSALIRRLRHSRLLSQQDLADECWRRNIQVSIATIKRAELGRAVRYRIARELARCFDLPVSRILQSSIDS